MPANMAGKATAVARRRRSASRLPAADALSGNRIHYSVSLLSNMGPSFLSCAPFGNASLGAATLARDGGQQQGRQVRTVVPSQLWSANAEWPMPSQDTDPLCATVLKPCSASMTPLTRRCAGGGTLWKAGLVSASVFSAASSPAASARGATPQYNPSISRNSGMVSRWFWAAASLCCAAHRALIAGFCAIH